MQQLMTREIAKTAPRLYEQDGAEDPTVYAHYFSCVNGWDWWLLEFDGTDSRYPYFVFQSLQLLPYAPSVFKYTFIQNILIYFNIVTMAIYFLMSFELFYFLDFATVKFILINL